MLDQIDCVRLRSKANRDFVDFRDDFLILVGFDSKLPGAFFSSQRRQCQCWQSQLQDNQKHQTQRRSLPMHFVALEILNYIKRFKFLKNFF